MKEPERLQFASIHCFLLLYCNAKNKRRDKNSLFQENLQLFDGKVAHPSWHRGPPRTNSCTFEYKQQLQKTTMDNVILAVGGGSIEQQKANKIYFDC
ncbi:hypothetical protein OUZ56_027300 [Daphnia magna]|uniref:Uncharacterized protein n=1 Tax=Daphnia magna TaxID=35525 RepID=A0ABQ9ZPF7_9CRUS|nr:hypothetical protein OUZ56_027300 [Daphnia magna]